MLNILDRPSRRLLMLLVTGALMVGGPVAVAPAQTGDATQNQEEDDDFPYGLLGLLGLAGLAGLKRRDDDRNRHTSGTSSGRV